MKRDSHVPPLDTPPGAPTGTWSRGRRTLVSMLVVLHLAAVIIPPFTLATSSPGTVSPLASELLVLVRPYVEAAYLWHGYAFFAPNPGPSHLVRYRLTFDDGRAPIVATFPDRDRHRPRLLYHRHFMLAEQLHADFVPPQFEDFVEMTRPPDQPESVDSATSPELRRYWELSRQAYDAKWRSFERHLRARYGASGVELVRVEHRLMSPDEFLGTRTPIDDESLYELLPEDLPRETSR